jgi:ethanolamine transporter EutH
MMATLLDLLRLPPERLGASLLLLAAFMVACEYLRISLATVFTRSVPVHVLSCLLTCVIQPVVLAVALVLGTIDHPDRAWLNMGLVACLYGVWYLAGQSTLLVRPDSQGADLGFMTVGALITFLPGLTAVAFC